jgi:hypothetical protein
MQFRTKFVTLGAACLAVSFLTACGGGSSDTPSQSVNDSKIAETPPVIRNTVAGTIALDDSGTVASLQATLVPGPGLQISLDDGVDLAVTDQNGVFSMTDVPNGGHSLFVHLANNEIVEIPFRMADGMSISLGKVSIQNGVLADFTGFNGYHFGFVDVDADGVNDNFRDANGDGIVDMGVTYGGYSYLMPHGFLDADGDGVNDLFQDGDGNGANDLDGRPYLMGFGWVDADGDGINDGFIDANGDGISDLNGLPFQQPFGWTDADADGINDRFVDENGDGINDVSGNGYVAMPGWVDLDGDGLNDFFRDADGNGLNDLSTTPMGYAHGFGWVDADGDGVNDRFIDTNGDGINDLATGSFVGLATMYGYLEQVVDANGDGINDNTAMPYMMGFGWVDTDGDGTNDIFADVNGDGVNDLTGRGYGMGFAVDANFSGTSMGGFNQWPMSGMGGGR